MGVVLLMTRNPVDVPAGIAISPTTSAGLAGTGPSATNQQPSRELVTGRVGTAAPRGTWSAKFLRSVAEKVSGQPFTTSYTVKSATGDLVTAKLIGYNTSARAAVYEVRKVGVVRSPIIESGVFAVFLDRFVPTQATALRLGPAAQVMIPWDTRPGDPALGPNVTGNWSSLDWWASQLGGIKWGSLPADRRAIVNYGILDSGKVGGANIGPASATGKVAAVRDAARAATNDLAFGLPLGNLAQWAGEGIARLFGGGSGGGEE